MLFILRILQQYLDTDRRASDGRYGAIAQGESEAKSESVKWGFQKRFEKGLPKLADLYGYTRDKRLLEIYEPEANVVRLIYQMFYDDKTIPETCYHLNSKAIPSPRVVVDILLR